MRYSELRNFGLTEEQKAVRESERKFTEKEILPVINDYEDKGQYPLDPIKKIGELGYLGAIISEEYDGVGMDFVNYSSICEEIGYGCWVVSSAINICNSLVGSGLQRHGSEAQKRRYLAPIARGEKLPCACFTEPNHGSDLSGIETTAKRDGDFYIINGSKIWISHANHADFFYVLATINRELKHRGVCIFLVDRETTGLQTRPFPLHCLKRGDTGEVVFEDCRIPSENLVGEEGRGFKVVATQLDIGRLNVASRCVGMAQYCADLSIKYARERVQFGKEIGEFQAIKHKIADMVTQVEAARLMVLRLAKVMDTGVRASMEASMTKLFASESGVRVALDAVQIHGGMGFGQEYPVGRILMELKTLCVGEGTSEIMRNLIGDYSIGYKEY
jgi:alkylation response protein AidB-like acyl-CoA dehydrogenase